MLSLSRAVNNTCNLCPGSGGVDVLPWSEMDSLQLETGHIKEQLVALNAAGYLTINSQPRVNGAPSADTNVGWGGPNGWVVSFRLHLLAFVQEGG